MVDVKALQCLNTVGSKGSLHVNCLVIHPLCPAMVGLWGQQPKQRGPDLPSPSSFYQLLWENTELFPDQPRDIISPACLGSALWSSPSWTCLDMPGSYSPEEPPQLAPLSLRESPTTLQRKPISAACIGGLVLSVTTHSS